MDNVKKKKKKNRHASTEKREWGKHESDGEINRERQMK